MLKTIALVMITCAAMACAGCGRGAPSSQPTTTHSATAPKELTLDLGDKVTLKLVQIPAGKFSMGSPGTEKGRDKDETQHEVTISKPFYMGETHVTVDQFAAFMRACDYMTDAEKAGTSLGLEIVDGDIVAKSVPGLSWHKASFEQKGDHPVVNVSWYDAAAFCEWLSRKSGKTVHLPTEAQWEYACRAGTKTAYPWGDNPDDGKGWANCDDQSLKKMTPNAPSDWDSFSWDDGFVFTSPVKSFRPNRFGLYDMIGNVSQWCADWYDFYKQDAVTDPLGGTPSLTRVIRGGAWDTRPAYCRSASRAAGLPDNRSYRSGFRVVVAGVD